MKEKVLCEPFAADAPLPPPPATAAREEVIHLIQHQTFIPHPSKERVLHM
ncbi:unnamed protein product [Gongylonema pulchrum]|uniref:Uncharacterized protein n=1 Tax=Gongylonema pulchrum TaxID=637853 RepID=A0A183DEP0_9BILA|nr:unnamed protein product [Gongylonema pulchrum]VDK60688.1 unnamed protein product [Gongylonema pulchrum]